MMASLGGERSQAEGAQIRHVPVMLAEVIEALRPKPGEVMVDGTFGAGGYTTRILNEGAEVIAIDRDPTAIEAGRAIEAGHPGRLHLVESRFSRLDEAVASVKGADFRVDGVVLDIGVSSMQIDQAERGFSFQKDGPLDMRMSGKGASAADVVNRLKMGDLARIFNFLGEERHAGRIARMIEKRRAIQPFTRTLDLANAIEALVGRNPRDRIHPATRVFQALRVFVNDELGELARALLAAERVLKPGGRLVVVTFHSLEDRMVKRFFADRAGGRAGSRHMPEVAERLPSFTPAVKGAVGPSAEEEAHNPRARSAKLRAGLRTQNPPLKNDLTLFGLPRLPDADELTRS